MNDVKFCELETNLQKQILQNYLPVKCSFLNIIKRTTTLCTKNISFANHIFDSYDKLFEMIKLHVIYGVCLPWILQYNHAIFSI